MPDKRYVDDLSIEELERVLAIKKRESRQAQMSRLRHSGRVIESPVEVLEPVMVSESPPQKRKAVPEFEDAIDAQDFKPKSNAGRIWRAFVDRSLLLLEIGAVVGLVFLGFALFNGLNILEEETAAAQAAANEARMASIPTIAPTPELTLANIVLPTGHIINENNQAVFNFNEIPQDQLSFVANQIYLPIDVARAPVTDDTPLRLSVPALNLDESIGQGVDWAALQAGVGMLPNGSLPRNQGDNVVLAAHNDIYGELFRDLDQLKPGDQMQIQTRAGVYTYVVRDTLIVQPDDVYVMESQGVAMLTLISCYPYQVNDKRIVVFADRLDA